MADYNTNGQHNPLYPDVQSNQPGLEVKAGELPEHAYEHVYPQAVHEHQPDPFGYSGRGQWQEHATNSGLDDKPPEKATEEKNRRVLGLKVPAFWAVVIVLVLVIAGAIAGGVAGGLSSQKTTSLSATGSDNSSSTNTVFPKATASSSGSATASSSRFATATTTSSATTGSPSPAPTDGGCPSINGTTYTPLNSTGESISIATGAAAQSFVEICDTNWPSGEGNGNPGVADIMVLYLPSLEDCMTACAQYNDGYKARGGVEGGYCGSVAILKGVGGNCYLKNSSTGNNETFGYPKAYSMGILISGV